jgi:rRNA maturation endonuclease Nob1
MAILGWNLNCESCNYKEFHQHLPREYNLRNCSKCGAKLIWNAKVFHGGLDALLGQELRSKS